MIGLQITYIRVELLKTREGENGEATHSNDSKTRSPSDTSQNPMVTDLCQIVVENKNRVIVLKRETQQVAAP